MEYCWSNAMTVQIGIGKSLLNASKTILSYFFLNHHPVLWIALVKARFIVITRTLTHQGHATIALIHNW